MISDGMDRHLTLRERLRIRLHLLMCTGCLQFSRQLDILRMAARTFAERATRKGGQLPYRGTP